MSENLLYNILSGKRPPGRHILAMAKVLGLTERPLLRFLIEGAIAQASPDALRLAIDDLRLRTGTPPPTFSGRRRIQQGRDPQPNVKAKAAVKKRKKKPQGDGTEPVPATTTATAPPTDQAPISGP